MVLDSLEKHDGTSISLSNVNILVGPNNVGKTRTLKDVQQIMGGSRHSNTVIFDDVSFDIPSSLDQFVRGLSIQENTENSQYMISGPDGSASVNFQDWNDWENSFDDNIDQIIDTISSTKFSFLDAGSRLQTASSQRVEGNRQNPRSVMGSLLYGSRENIADLRTAFQRTFGEDIILNYSSMPDVDFQIDDNFSDVPEHPMELGEHLDSVNSTSLDDQGDGFLSFVGVVISILISEGRIILLDEPDAFLHPPQARILGNWIAERAETTPGQVLIATHDSDFLFGILESSSDVKIFRLNRPGISTQFRQLSQRTTDKLAEDHLLSSQRVLRAVFHEGVVVCEGGKDRVVYQTVASTELNQPDLLFVDALGWKVIERVVGILSAASIPVAAIADLDVLKERDEFKQLLLSFKRASAYNEIEHIIETRNNIASAVSDNGDWDLVKAEGVRGFPSDVRDDVWSIIDEVKKYGLFLVNAGELESWMDLEHINDPWSIAALDVIDEEDTDTINNEGHSPNIVDFVTETCNFVDDEYSQS
jgi:hypothetical protein